ncbi:MAG: ATP-binding cassette domain-containing protein [SAR324 cluster bacterium]|nr:ATP-binding cassette domain-containing protein [SAR324 cluster bacterium]
MDNTKKNIEIADLSVIYPNGYAALKSVDVTLQTHKVYGLVGANGAGKSTLFKAIMGLIKPSKGHISIFGKSVKDALRQNLISYVPQTEEVNWNFPVLVQDVIMMGRYRQMGFLRRPSKRDHQIVDDVLSLIKMSEFKKRQIGELSGGQKKRVFVARALAQGGEIILLDEPFSGIDIKTEEELIILFKSLSKEGKLILTSTHNLGSVPRFCDEVILINKTILCHGEVEDVFTTKNLAKAFGGFLRHHTLLGGDLHKDEDKRGLTVMSDDERPLVFYGNAKGGQKIINKDKKQKIETKK